MSEPKRISPLLDGFSIGSAISNHDGVRCYPAVKEDSEERYIVKIISIPASQVQLDALLLTGAYTESSAALDYFRELADNVEREAAALKNLSRVEGFLAFEGWQVVPLEGRPGFEVYLLSRFRHALESYVRRNNMTHLAAVNLGIDICSALSAARRAGWIYADLKPSNIYISEDQEFRIGDLGLMELDGLDLADLPGKYRSAYTPPELADELLSPNTTMDTYALGMILYQIYNNGQLPQVDHPDEDVPPPPCNADYELSEILLKALDPDPAQRWEDPVQMGQALVAYMQRNEVKEIPIIPPVADLPVETDSAPLADTRQDETLPGINDDPHMPQETLSAEMSDMMSRADDLISHTPPAPPVAPESASVEELEAQIQKDIQEQPISNDATPEQTMPPLEVTKPAPGKNKPSTASDSAQDITNLDAQQRKTRRKGWLASIALVLVLALAAVGGYLFYTEYYIQMITSLSVTGMEDEMTVRLDTEIDENLLTVVCTDTYGNTMLQPVSDGQASFTGLLPDMLYKVRVEIEGFHRLDGCTTHEYVTPAETRIAGFTAATGQEDGSVILSFTVEGPDSEEWTAFCTAEGQETVTATFTGHMVTITGLAVGETYAIRLEPATELYIPGGSNLEFTASAIVIAENLNIRISGTDSLNVSWQAPEGSTVENWTVHCYNTDGFDQTIVTDQLSASFEGITLGSAYTVEVTAAGMTQPARAGITANPVTITGIQVDDTDPMSLLVSWTFDGTAPENGWLLLYTIDNGTQPQVVQCQENSGLVEVRVPKATYTFTIQAADGSTVFENVHTYKAPGAEVYENEPQAFYRKAQSASFFADLLKTPGKANWNHQDVSRHMYTSTFAPDERISVLMYFMKDFYIRHEDITVMYVIRDENDMALSEYLAIENLDWRDDLWNGPNYHYCGLDIPKVPTQPGKYKLDIYFDGEAITSLEFTITE